MHKSGGEQKMRTEIIYEDKDVLVIYKPAGLATQSARVGQADVVSELKSYLVQRSAGKGTARERNVPYLGIIHRLDQPVEGLLVFGKNKSASAKLTEQLRAGEGLLTKRYYAVVCGKPAADEARLVDEMYKDTNGKAQIPGKTDAKIADAKPAILEYRLLKSIGISEKEVSLVDISIETGRFHQIRAQMAHAGLPLLGDAKYGNEETMLLSGELSVRNVALCAYGLEFMHPVTKEKKQFRIKPRADVFSKFDHK